MENNWISLNEALDLCKDWGLSVTASGLLYAARQQGFVRHMKDDFHYEYNKKSLIEYIQKAIEKVPAGWITIREAAELIKKCIGTIYYSINSGKLKSEQFGRNRLYYVKEKEVKKLFSKEINNE